MPIFLQEPKIIMYLCRQLKSPILMKTEHTIYTDPERCADPLEEGGLLTPTPANSSYIVTITPDEKPCREGKLQALVERLKSKVLQLGNEQEELHDSYNESQTQLMNFCLENNRRNEGRIARLKETHRQEMKGVTEACTELNDENSRLRQQNEALLQENDRLKRHNIMLEHENNLLHLQRPPAEGEQPEVAPPVVDIFSLIEYGMQFQSAQQVEFVHTMLVNLVYKGNCQDPEVKRLLDELKEYGNSLRRPISLNISQNNTNCQQFLGEVSF